MKNYLLSGVAVICMSITTLAQIPNAGFENWTTVKTYSNPDGWGTMNNTTTLASVYTATKGTPGNPGASYLKLTSKTVASAVVNGIAVSGVLDSVNMKPKSGFACTSRPANLTGKWQHMISGSSQGSIQITLTRWDKGMNMQMPVGSGSVTLSGMAMSWADFSIPISYTDGGNPDTCIIVMKASGSSPANGDYLWVDNLAFSGTVTGIENKSLFLNNLSISPNPSNDHMNIVLSLNVPQQISIEITDITGRLIRSENIGYIQRDFNHTMDLTGIPKGTYLLRILGAHAVETQKINIQ